MKNITQLISSTEELVNRAEQALSSIESAEVSEADQTKLLDLAKRTAGAKEDIAKKKTSLLMFLASLTMEMDIRKISICKGGLKHISFSRSPYQSSGANLLCGHGESIRGLFGNVPIRQLVDHHDFPFEELCTKIVELVSEKLDKDGQTAIKSSNEFQRTWKEILPLLEKIEVLAQ